MYDSRVEGHALFEVTSQGYGQPITTFGVTDKGETPMSLVNIALASCVTMCVQGYFAKWQSRKDIRIATDSSYREGNFTLTVLLEEELTAELEAEVRAYVAERCRVKQLFREDISVSIVFERFLE